MPNQSLQQTAAAISVSREFKALGAAAAAELGRSAAEGFRDVQPLMAVDQVVRVRGKPLVVLGKLTGGPVRVGQALALRSAGVELVAEVAWVSLGFDKLPPQRAEVGDNVALGLRGESLAQVEGGGWLVFDAEPVAAADRGLTRPVDG